MSQHSKWCHLFIIGLFDAHSRRHSNSMHNNVVPRTKYYTHRMSMNRVAANLIQTNLNCKCAINKAIDALKHDEL